MPGNGWAHVEAVANGTTQSPENRYAPWSQGWANYTGLTPCGSDTQCDDLWGLQTDPPSPFFKPGERNAFPLNYGLLELPLPGDFLPVGSTLGSHTLALVPTRMATKSTSWNGLGRATLDDCVDLVTGVPLVQYSDLTLPFSGGAFRLIRTRSADRALTGRRAVGMHGVGDGVSESQNRWWDWCGEGWMMSENPLLIIDSTMADDVAGGLPRCYLWLDAFHSIPFDWVSTGNTPDNSASTGFYDCAPRYRAKLTISRAGQVQPVRRIAESQGETPNMGQWLRHPDKFEVSLFDGEVVYEFVPVWQDAPSEQWQWNWHSPPDDGHDVVWTSVHERPTLPFDTGDLDPGQRDAAAFRSPWDCDPIHSDTSQHDRPKVNGRGQGMPHYGLVTKIRDRFGNRAEIDYAPLTEWGVTNRMAGEVGEPARVQYTSQKGQIREIRLVNANGQVQWTLVYAYRMVPISDSSIVPGAVATNWDALDPHEQMAWSSPALDTIYAFEGAVNTRRVTLLRGPDESISDEAHQSRLRPSDENDILSRYVNALPTASLEWPGDEELGTSQLSPDLHWKFRCRYHYATKDNGATEISREYRVCWPPVLLRSQTDEYSAQRDLATAPDRNHVFWYGQNPAFSHTRWLTDMFDDSGIDRAAKALASPGTTHVANIEKLMEVGRNSDSLLSNFTYASGYSAKDMHEAALVWLANSNEDDASLQAGSPYPSCSAGNVSDDGLLPDNSGNYVTDSARGTVSAVSFTDPRDGRRRYCRVSRFLRMPETDGEAIHDSYVSDARPMRSIFRSPFWWHAYPQGDTFRWPHTGLTWSSGSKAAKETDYSVARWVAMVDEFPTWNAMELAHETPIGSGASAKKSFYNGSNSRRIVGMNPLGNVLWQKSYFLDGNGFTESGDTGLSETFVYKNGADLLAELAGATPVPAPEDSFKIERFLVARKSTGWAAADIANHGANEGLISVFTYGIVSADTAKSWGERIKPVADGIRCGDSGTVYYKNQTFYDASDPTSAIASAQFTTPRTTLLNAPSGGNTGALEQAGVVLTQLKLAKPINADGTYQKIDTRGISPRRSIRPGLASSGDAYYDISQDITNSLGLSVWTINAFVHDPVNLNIAGDPNAQATFTYHIFDALGRETDTWEDIDPGTAASPNTNVRPEDRALIPADMVRKSPSAPAALHTERWYDMHEMTDVIYPNGRRWATRSTTVDDSTDPTKQRNQGKPIKRVFTFNDLVPNNPLDQNPTVYKPTSICMIRDYAELGNPEPLWLGQMNQSEQSQTVIEHFRDSSKRTTMLSSTAVWFTGTVDLAHVIDYSGYEKAPDVALGYDSAGRLNKVTDLDLDWSGGIGATAEIQDNGDRIRVKEMDGNATIQLRNARGQIVRKYTGTDSFAWDDLAYTFPTDPSSAPDMILRERTEFGRGPTNALMPFRRWNYLSTPTWQSSVSDPYAKPPTDDWEGELTQTSYDWRMRPVKVETFGPAPAPPVYRGDSTTEPTADRPLLSTRLTFLDHAERTILEVSFGPGEVTNLISFDPSRFAPDPTQIGTDSAVGYLVAAILDANPTSLTQTYYFDDGSVREKRIYRLHSSASGGYSGSGDYFAERYGYGVGGKQIFAQHPGSRTVQMTEYDNVGRVHCERTILPRTVGGAQTYDYEVTRTDYRYDKDGNTILTDHWERIMDSGATPTGDAVLSRANAVRQRTENWYDMAKRLVATAECGSSSADGTFSTPNDAIPIDTRLGTRLGQGMATPELVVDGTTNPPTLSTEKHGLVPDGARLSLNAYDRAGNKIASAAPQTESTWTYTTYLYDAKNRLLLQVDDATGKKRRTKYAYWLGRTISISSPTADDPASTPDPALHPTCQTQGVVYGAQIVGEFIDAEQRPYLGYISRSNALVGAMMSVNPDSETRDGWARSTEINSTNTTMLRPDVIKGLAQFQYNKPDFAYRYYADGLIAERVDRRKIAIRYFYDELRRLRELEVWHYAGIPSNASIGAVGTAQNIYPLEYASRGYPSAPSNAVTDIPTDRVGYISYSYDSRGNLTRVTAQESRDDVDGQGNAKYITDTKYVYDERNNLVREYQAHGASADATDTPYIDYTRNYSGATAATSGMDRLVSMTYPAFAGLGLGADVAGSRTLNLGYGSAGSADDAASRIDAMTWGNFPVATFGYTGTGRRVSTGLGGTASAPAIRQNFGSANSSVVGLPGLDSFGRVRDLHYINSATSDSTLWRGEYVYDAAGNRLQEKLTQRPHPSSDPSSSTPVSGSNTRSRLFDYDTLDRLTRVDGGHISESGAMEPSDAYAAVRTEKWSLDKLGNWVGEHDQHSVSPMIDPCAWPTIGPSDGDHHPWHGNHPPGATQALSVVTTPGHSVELGEGTSSHSFLLKEVHYIEPGIAESNASAAGHTREPAAQRARSGPEAWQRQQGDVGGRDRDRRLRQHGLRRGVLLPVRRLEPALPGQPEGHAHRVPIRHGGTPTNFPRAASGRRAAAFAR